MSQPTRPTRAPSRLCCLADLALALSAVIPAVAVSPPQPLARLVAMA
ncbi:hypothetical protein [Streptomyces melanogenes]